MITFRIKEVWKMPAPRSLCVSNLCRHVRGVVVVSSYHAPRGSLQGRGRVHVFKCRYKSMVIHILYAFEIEVVT